MESKSSDADLLSAFILGDAAALGLLAERYETSMLGLSRGLLRGSTELACDAVQNTWVKVIRFADTFKGQSTFKTWLYRILINECRTVVKQQNGSLKITTRFGGQSRIESVTNDNDIDSREHLYQAIATLDPKQQELLLLCHHHGMTHQQASEVLGIPLGTLKTRMQATLKELRERLTPEILA